MATSFMTYGMDQIPDPNEGFVDLRNPLPLHLMTKMSEGIDSFGRYAQYKYSPAQSAKTIVIRVYPKRGDRIAHLIGEIVFTDEERFAPLPSPLVVNINTEMPEKVPDGTNPE